MEDIVSIKSTLMKQVAGKALHKAIYKKLGCDVGVWINELEMSHNDNLVNFKISLEGSATEDNFKDLLKVLL